MKKRQSLTSRMVREKILALLYRVQGRVPHFVLQRLRALPKERRPTGCVLYGQRHRNPRVCAAVRSGCL